MTSKWLELSGSLYLFGEGGINRIEPVDQRDTHKKYIYITELYQGLSRIAAVKESLEEIKEMLNNDK